MLEHAGSLMGQSQKLDMNEFLPEFGMTRQELAEHLKPAVDDIGAGRTKTSDELREKYRRQRQERSSSRRGQLITR
jgi:hypothetical protein